MRFLHPSSRGRTLPSAFCSELLPRCFTTCQFAVSLLCTSHGIETSLLTLLLLRLERGELEAALALESDGGRGGGCEHQWLLLLWCTGLVVPWHVRSSQTRGRTSVPSIARWILNHWTTREVPCLHACIYLSNNALLRCYSHDLEIP